VSAAAALFRLARRTARRHLGRTLFVGVLVALGVAVAVFAAIAVRTAQPTPEEDVVGLMGQATARIVVSPAGTPGVTPADPGTVEAWLARELDTAGIPATIYREEWIGPGLATDLDPTDARAAGMYVVDGSVPTTADEILASPAILRERGLAVGDTIRLPAADGMASFQIVGTVVRPESLHFPMFLFTPGGWDRLRQVELQSANVVALTGEIDDVAALSTRLGTSFRERFGPSGVATAAPGPGVGGPFDVWEPPIETREEARWEAAQSRTPASLVGVGVAALLLIEVGLLAAAAYAVGLRRRLRELGLLVANGATERQIRGIVLGEAAVVGAFGALVGVALGVGVAFVSGGLLGSMINRLVSGPRIVFGDLAGPAIIGVGATMLAAWLPARTAGRVPPLAALRGRMPASAPPRWLVPVALGGTGAGAAMLVALAATPLDTGGLMALGAVGMILTVIGGLALTVKIVEVGGRLADRLTTTPRLVVREAARARTKAAAAMAAMAIVFVGPALWAISTQTSEASRLVTSGPPGDPRVVTVIGAWPAGAPAGGPPGAGDWETDPSQAEAVAAILPDARRLGVEVVALPVNVLSEEGRVSSWVEGATVAEPALLELLGLDEGAIPPSSPVALGSQPGATSVAIGGERYDEVPIIPVDHQIRGLPHVLVAPAWMADRGAPTVRRFVFSLDRPLTRRERSALYDLPFRVGLVSVSPVGPVEAVLLAIGAAALVALIIGGAVTALTTAETDPEVQLLVAVGAAPSIRRRLAGFRAAYLALCAAVLAVVLALVIVWATADRTGGLFVGAFGTWRPGTTVVPWPVIGFLVVGVPILLGGLIALGVRSAPTMPPRRAG